jgi:KAP family P-loop domain
VATAINPSRSKPKFERSARAVPGDRDLSASVRKLWRADPIDPQATTGHAVARFLLQEPAHGAYGAQHGPSIEVGEPETGTARRSIDDLIAAVRALFLPQEPGKLDGRKVVFGLALLDPTLRRSLEEGGFLDALGKEIDLHANLSGRGKALYLPDAVPTLSDQPSTVDRLGRRAFADALGSRLHDEYQRSRREFGRAESFMLHLEGPWGSGKTSLLNFLRDDLRRRKPRWLVVEFNAWQHQRAGAPWWLLMAAVQREALRDWRSPVRIPLLFVGAVAWRVWLAKLWLLALAAGVALLAGLIVSNGSLGGNDVAKLAGALGSIVGVIVAVVGLVRSFAGNNARGAETFVQQTRDPMKRLQRRFNWIVWAIGRPIAVFIDDLDRCRAEHVVDLLEGIQTVLRDAPVTFVVAADRHWLYESYAQVYEQHVRDDPGRPLGHLFLEKTFQLSTSLPRLSAREREEYWEALIFPRERDREEIARLEREIAKSFEGAHSEPEVMERLDRRPGEGRLEQRLRREAAVRRLGAPELIRHTEHTLSRFAGLLEPNPRAMKRLVNAYGVERAVQILEGHSSELSHPREKLALWAIVKSRWPLLAEYLSEHVELIEPLRAATVPPEVERETQRPYLARLFQDPEVQRVVCGNGLDAIELDREALTLFICGPAAEQSLVHG